MKKFLVLVLLSLNIVSVSAFENLSWESKSLSAGKVDVTTGGYTIVYSLAVANLSPEFRMPIQLVYDSLDSKPGMFGDSWRSPQLESRVFPRENGAEWVAPWGERIAFFEKEKGRGLYSPYSEWEASGAHGNWIIKHKDGWKFEYRDSYLREISSPANRKLIFEYEEKNLIRVVQNNQTFVELKYSKEGRPEEISINGGKFSLDYVINQVSVLPDKSWFRARTTEKTFISEIRNGELTPLRFSYSEDGFLCEIRNGQLVEQLATQKETLDQRIGYLKKAEEAKTPSYQEVKSGRLIRDRYFEYFYAPDGAVTMKNSEGQTSSISYNMMKGVLKVRDFSGLASEIYYFRRYDVAYNGKLRQIRDSRDRTVVNCRYDKGTGKPVIIRDMADNETYYTYDKNENVTLISRSESDDPRRPLVSFKYDANKNPIEVDLLDKAGKPVYMTRLQYDQHSQITSAETEESSHKFQYNTFGLLTKSIDTFGMAVSREYDKFNRLSSVVNADGTCIAYTYSGSKIAVIEKFAASGKKELLSSVKFSYGKDTGMLVSYSDDRGSNFKFDRDAEGKIIAQYYPDGTSVKYSLDTMGRLEEVRDQNDNPIKFAYCKFDKISSNTTAVGQTANYQYSQYGCLLKNYRGEVSHRRYPTPMTSLTGAHA